MTLHDDAITAIAAVETARTALDTIASKTDSSEAAGRMPGTSIHGDIGRVREALDRIASQFHKLKDASA
jgi:hypothetical protein